ncbi:helix-turn-helix domain-containing protein [Paenibacillus alkalitolerans]|uniref:helix-turn-helix domain-containing protein n=1 Tax=Paenibacillus alkalitolerans TaxID=2799335 RepID=UPI0018F3B091|nr:helix-turn-helix domain-containing protein [Paenibacillus alkalitolerans]
MSDLVSDKGNAKQNLKENLTYLQLNPYFSFPTVALIEPAGSLREEDEKRQIKHQIRAFLEEHLSNDCIVFLDESGRIGILFSWVSKEVMEAVRTMLKKYFANPVNIGVGKPCNQLSVIHSSYTEASHALQYKFYKGTGQIIYFSELGKYESSGDYPAAKEQELFQYIRSAKCPSEIEQAVNEFYQYILRNGPVEIINIYELSIRLLVGIEKRILAADLKGGYKSYEVMSIIKMETLQEIKLYVSKYLTDIAEILSQNARVNHRSIIKKTIQYMEQECQHATLHSVAKKVYMTPAYLSLLFKTNTGKTFIEQLTDIRMDKAKDMLKSTHLKNYEVAVRVGYHDSRYFSQIFKKKVGVSPSEYRASLGH